MPFSELRREVIDSDLCASCGACEFVCPENAIMMDELTPKLVTESAEASCGSCRQCVEVCPGKHTGVSAAELSLFGRTRTHEERWLGIFRRQIRAHSLDREIYTASSSGGCTTAFLLAAMDRLQLDYVIVAGREHARPWRAASSVCRSKDELLQATQSTYQLFPHLRILKTLRESDPMASIGVVALPCQVQAIRKLQNMSGAIAEYARRNIKFVQEIACSSNTLPSGTETLIEHEAAVPKDSVRDVKFREGEYPGDFVIHLKGGARKTVPLWKAVEHFKRFKTHRCLSCGDWMSGLADVSVCDGDPNIFKSSAMVHERVPKHGRVLIRTKVGQEVVDAALRLGLIEIGDGEVARMNLGLERKRNRRAHYETCEEEIPDPPIRGFREAAPAMSDDAVIRESLTR